MTEKIRESISALMDDEISEIEVHRLLRHYTQEQAREHASEPVNGPSMKASWIAYQQIRAVARGERLLSTSQHLDLHERISAAVAADSDTRFGDATIRRSTHVNKWLKPAAGLAVAASVVAAVLIGVNQPPSGQGDATFAGNAPDHSQQVAVSTLDTAVMAGAVEGPIELTELDAEAQQRVRRYLNQHGGMIRTDSNVRTATFKKPAGKN